MRSAPDPGASDALSQSRAPEGPSPDLSPHSADSRHQDAALRASEDRYRLLFDHNPQPLLLCDEEAESIVEANVAACALYGFDNAELLKNTLSTLTVSQPTHAAASRLHPFAGPGRSGLTWHRRKDGGEIAVEIELHPVEMEHGRATLVRIEEVTQQLRLEEQALEGARLEAAGQLAGGLAHDLNNLLTVIRGSATLAKLDVPAEGAVAARLAAIERSSVKAGELIQQLLAFSRRQLLQPRAVELHVLLARLEPLLRKILAEDIELSFDLGDEPAWVFLDPSQLEQVLLTLAAFSRESMPRGGRLEITLVAETNGLPGSTSELIRSGFHLLALRDTGEGLDEEALLHLFEPFYKKSGGTGLGLAMVYGVMRQSGGAVEVDSLLTQGTTFRLYLPQAAAVLPAEPASPLLWSQLSGRRAGRITSVLLAEDQREVRELVRDVLSRHGMEVYSAASGLDALAMMSQLERAPDLLITDVVMPGLSGRELAQRITRHLPNLPVLYISGYTHDVLGRKGVLEGGVELLPKPFTPEQLLAMVSKLLTRGSNAPRMGAPAAALI